MSLWFDSGWPPPLSSVTAYAGYLFYLSPGDNRRPDPTAETLQQHLAAGRDLAPIWQAGKTDISAGGFDLGVQHAKAANADADAKGAPAWVPIIYACDSDYFPAGWDRTTLASYQGVLAYFRGVLSVPGRPVAAYGGSFLLDALHDDASIRYGMQTANSWSRDAAGNLHVSEWAQFLQYNPPVAVPGGSVDEDESLKPYPTWKTGAPPVTHQQRYPKADTTSQWYSGGQYGGTMMPKVNVLVLHTTEGPGGFPDYSGGSVAPTITGRPVISERRLDWRQHFLINESGRALENKLGGVQTNTLNVAQIEMVGTCDSRLKDTWVLGGRTYRANVDYICWAYPPDWAVAEVADFLRFLHEQWEVPLTSGLTFTPYPNGPSARMSFDQWNNFVGVCGHEHVPENSHGDPGAFPINTLLAMASGSTTGEDDNPMADLSDSDKQFFRDLFRDNNNELLYRQFTGLAQSGIFGSGDATHQARQLKGDSETWPVAQQGQSPAVRGAAPAAGEKYTLEKTLRAMGIDKPGSNAAGDA